MKKTKPSNGVVNVDELQEAFGKDLDLFLFFVTWLKNGLNATKAYQELHPDVDYHSATVLGSRMLGKVSREQVMTAYGLGAEKYFEQLRDGLNATKRDHFTGEIYEDHVARKPYHDKLGKLLGIEVEAPQTAVQVNISEMVIKERKERGLE